MICNKQTLLFILLLIFTTVSCKKATPTFSNVIDLKNSPSHAADKELNAFFDLGSWMGFALSEDKTETGFSGPYILGLEHGFWASNNFASLDLITENGNSLLTNLDHSEQDYFPGKLENKLHFEHINLVSNLLFTSNKSLIISTTITNNGNQNLKFTPQWKGEIFHQIGSLVNKETHLITLLDNEQKIFLSPISDELFKIQSNSNNYTISLHNSILKSKETKTYSIEIQYHPDNNLLVKLNYQKQKKPIN